VNDPTATSLLVSVLPAATGTIKPLNFKVVIIYNDFFYRWINNGDCYRTRVSAVAFFSWWDSLDSMTARFLLKA